MAGWPILSESRFLNGLPHPSRVLGGRVGSGQGECLPVSSATRLRGMGRTLPATLSPWYALAVPVVSDPIPSSTQYQLLRSPRSSPMVSVCREIFLPCFATAVLTFFIAGLLFICASSTSITWERTRHPVRRPAFSFHLVMSGDYVR